MCARRFMPVSVYRAKPHDGINIDNRMIVKARWTASCRAQWRPFFPPIQRRAKCRERSASGATRAGGREGARLGVIALKDNMGKGAAVKAFSSTKMGIKTVMITGDNRLTAAAIAARSRCQTIFFAEATPEAEAGADRQRISGGRTAGRHDRRQALLRYWRWRRLTSRWR